MSKSSRYKWWVLTSVGLAGLIIAIDFTIVNTVLANIQAELQTSVGQLSWVMAGFGLLFCTFLVTMGRLGDIIGRRLLLYIGVIGFGVASLGAGLSQSPWQLILFRILQGAFGGIVFPCGIAITADAFPKNESGRALGIYGSILGIGLAAGPVLGGLIATLTSWRWIFFINIPVILVTLGLCFIFVRESKLPTKIPIDWWGFSFITLFVATLVFAINESPTLGWGNPLIIGCLAATIIFLIITIAIELNVKYPLIPFQFFMHRNISLSVIITITSISFAWAIIFMIPLYLHNILDFPTGKVGLFMLPMTMMTAIFPTIAGHYLDKHGPRLITIFMFICLITGLAMMLFLNTSMQVTLMVIAFIIYGIAWGIGNGIGIPIGLTQMESSENAGMLSGALITILNIFGVISLTVGVTVFRYQEHIYLFSQIKQQQLHLTTAQQHIIRSLLSNPEKARQYANMLGNKGSNILQLFKFSFIHGFHIMLLMFIGLSVLGLLLALMILCKRDDTETSS